jgi:hypothetical protein
MHERAMDVGRISSVSVQESCKKHKNSKQSESALQSEFLTTQKIKDLRDSDGAYSRS